MVYYKYKLNIFINIIIINNIKDNNTGIVEPTNDSYRGEEITFNVSGGEETTFNLNLSRSEENPSRGEENYYNNYN